MKLDQEIVLSCAFRYALGRMTYVVDSVAGEIERNVAILPARDLHRYIKEIGEAIAEDRAGMNMDIKRWSRCSVVLERELKHRG